MPEPPTTTLLEDAIDIPTWLEADRSTPLSERTHRDREIGRELVGGDEPARVRGWWRRLEHGGEALPGRRLDHARGWINLALALVGLIGGTGITLAAFRYDGTYPVNVVLLLALLVVPQLILLVLNLLLIPGRVPGLRIVQDALAALNPGALAAAAYRQFSRGSGPQVFGWTQAATSAMRRFAKWQMLHWSQIAAVALNVGIVATAAVLIAFTDLAFGWTTTLDVDASTAAEIFRAIALPWSALFPSAVPDASLVERSQFFRLGGYEGLADSRTLTGWWSFSVLAVVTYGLLPRLAFLGFSGWRLRAATQHLLMSDARVTALLDRLSAPDLETRGVDGSIDTQPLAPAAAAVSRTELAGDASTVIWNQSVATDAAGELIGARLGLAVTTVIEAGSGSLDAERRALEQLAGTNDPVVVLTPAWEPPLLEFVDFIKVLRAAIGESPSIIVVPVAEDAGEITDIECDNWRRAVGKSGDARAYVETGEA